MTRNRSNFNPRFVLLKDTVTVDKEGILVPAGCLVQEIKSDGKEPSDQLLLECLDSFPPRHSTGALDQLYVQASLDDLLEVSSFAASLLQAEAHFKRRLIVSRDENWLEEATQMFE